MKPALKFTLTNTIFFGVVGSLIAGVIPAIFFSRLMFDPWMERVDLLFVSYVVESIGLGFIPASITGYIYSRMYKTEFLKRGAVDFWKEIRLSAITSASVVFTICFVIILALLGFAYFNSSTSDEIWNLIQFSALTSLLLILFGLVAGVSCSNLIREWNQKLVVNLS